MAVYTKQIFTLLFQRLTSSKTTKFVKSLLVFYGLFICKYGAVAFIQLIDSIQPKMFGMVVDRLIIAETQKVTGAKEKKFVAVGITKLLCEAPETIIGDYSNYWFVILYLDICWFVSFFVSLSVKFMMKLVLFFIIYRPPLLQALIGLFELPEDSTVPFDEHFIEIEDTPGYQTAYSQLVFAGNAEADPFKGKIINSEFTANNIAFTSHLEKNNFDSGLLEFY